MVDNLALDCFRFAVHRVSDVVNVVRFGPVYVIARVVFQQFSDGANIQFREQHRSAPRADAFQILKRISEHCKFVYIR